MAITAGTAPGVLVRQGDSGSAPIAGAGTSTAGFLGVSATGKGPTLCTSYRQFVREFHGGKNLADLDTRAKHLSVAVQGFFLNGGSRCFVSTVIVSGDAEPTPAVINTVLNSLAAVDEIALVVAPGLLNKTSLQTIHQHCAATQSCFAILDGPESGFQPDPIITNVGSTDYGAMYMPWIDVGDEDTNGNPVYYPPSGHIAGIYARVDAARGVFKAPANEVVRGAFGVSERIGRQKQGPLNDKGLNAIRDLTGNITVWGARTLAGADKAEWRYVNVRRTFIFLRESIDRGTQWAVFEPNDAALWAKITRNVSAFLTNVWRDGGLFGSTPEEAFYVKCDADTNPPALRDLGQVVAEIGVSVVKPAEFVVFNISQSTG